MRPCVVGALVFARRISHPLPWDKGTLEAKQRAGVRGWAVVFFTIQFGSFVPKLAAGEGQEQCFQIGATRADTRHAMAG